MILVTGGTGFIGKALIRQLASADRQVRMLIRPSKRSPDLPTGVPIEVAVCSLKDSAGLRAAMKGVDVVYHLVGVEGQGNRGDLLSVDIQGTQAVVQAAQDAGVGRFFYLSHLGADRASAFPVLKAKAIAEAHIRQSSLDYTILRSALVYGPGDHFTTGLAGLLHKSPGIFLLPGDGNALVQPLFVEDLVTCLLWALDDDNTRRQLYQIGGPEALPFRAVVELVMSATGIHRTLVNFPSSYLRPLTVLLEQSSRSFPVSVFWLDYLAADRTCGVDSVTRAFGLLPARFNARLHHLQARQWQKPARKLSLRKTR
jgi:NADH dehydrogenase